MTDPERLDLESASSAYRRRRCPGSVNLVRILRKSSKLQAPLPDPDAESGTLVHAAWCTGQNGELSPMQLQTLEHLVRMEALLVADWAGNDPYTLLGREVRLWLHEGFEPVHSGQYDAMYGTITTKRLLILDAKTLFSEVTPAESNDQLRELVALARFNYPLAKEFTVAILQPWVSTRPSLAIYDQPEAELALRSLRLSIADSNDPDAPRIPGTWCRHCPALTQCEEARAQSMVAVSLAKRIQKGEYTMPTGSKGAQVLELIAAAEPVFKALRERYKIILSEDPDAVPGWYLKEGKKVREINNIQAAYNLALPAIGVEEFFSAASLKISALERAFGKASRLKGQALERSFNDTFGALITLKAYAPELVQISERKNPHKALKS